MKALKTPYTCGCGQVNYRIPEKHKIGLESLDQYPGYYWDCVCGSSHYTKPELVRDADFCDCEDCKDHEGTPCEMDCEVCQGCKEARLDRADAEHEIGQSQGRK